MRNLYGPEGATVDERDRRTPILVNRFRENPMIPLLDSPRSAASEEFRKAVVPPAGQSLGVEKGITLVLSPLEGEGKSMTSVNVALALAEHGGLRVLLLDFDLRRPSIEPLLAEGERRGLADVLREEARLGEVVQKCPHEGLYVLTAGRRPATAVERLDATRAGAVLQSLRERFDVVIGDCPPLLPFAETRMLAGLADRLLLVVRAERTPRRAIVDALDLLDRERLIGVVLNAVPANRWHYYGYSYSYQWPQADDGGDER